MTLTPTPFEIGDPAYINCTAANVPGWERIEIRRVSTMSPICTGTFESLELTTVIQDSTIDVIHTSTTESSVSLMLKIDQVPCRSDLLEEYKCEVIIGEDSLRTSSSVELQSMYKHVLVRFFSEVIYKQVFLTYLF